jgi:hypothetical protein
MDTTRVVMDTTYVSLGSIMYDTYVVWVCHVCAIVTIHMYHVYVIYSTV